MSGKQILLNALRRQPTPRVPWVPFVGVHGGSLIGVDASAYLCSADSIVAGLEAAVAKYRPDGIPVAFDLQLEAEVLGCQLAWAKETPPSVATHPLGSDYNLEGLPSFSVAEGRLPLVLEAVRRCKKSFGEEVALYGLLTGPLTLALHLRGDELLLDLFDADENVNRLLAYCVSVAKKMVDAYLEAGIDVVAVVDPMISQIGPAHFKEFVAPSLNELFDHIRARGSLSSLFVCGNATRNLEAMAETSCDNISIDENIDLSALARICRAAGKSFGGNLQLTVVLLLGDTNDARRNAVACLDKAGDTPGYVLAPGCDLPYAVKTENLEAVAELIHDPYKQEVARRLPPKEMTDTFEDVAIPDYAKQPAVIVDVVTLDSAGCAPCAYMLKAAEEAAKAYGRPAEVREHKITGRDGLGYMTKLGVTAIPSICVDGHERFASIIPEREVLVATLADAAAQKQN